MLKELINIWNANDLSRQAWDQSYEMLNLSRDIFSKAIVYLLVVFFFVPLSLIFIVR